MAAPIDADWANNPLSDASLNATTHGSGTTATRTGLSSWPANRPFFDTTDDTWYYNSHVSAPSSVTWTKVEGKTPLKRRCVVGSTFYDASTASGTSYYWGIHGAWVLAAGATEVVFNAASASTCAMPITSEAITVKRLHVFVKVPGVTTSTYEVELYNETDAAAIHTFTPTYAGGSIHLDSGDISVSVTGGDSLCWRWKGNGTASGTLQLMVSFEYEYDDIY